MSYLEEMFEFLEVRCNICASGNIMEFYGKGYCCNECGKYNDDSTADFDYEKLCAYIMKDNSIEKIASLLSYWNSSTNAYTVYDVLKIGDTQTLLACQPYCNIEILPSSINSKVKDSLCVQLWKYLTLTPN